MLLQTGEELILFANIVFLYRADLFKQRSKCIQILLRIDTVDRNFSKSPCIYDLMIQALPLITSGR